MTDAPTGDIQQRIEVLYRRERGRILATLIRLLGDFDRAEDALHDAFRAAVERWPKEGEPENPRAWLISTGRFKAIDAVRRNARLERHEDAIAHVLHGEAAGVASTDELQDDRLKLIFTCCHPAIPADARAALTLREICGLTTEEIARAFLTSAPAVAQRIVRAKAKIREAGIPYQVPEGPERAERLGTVLAVVYLVYNEGYSASSGTAVSRPELAQEAIRLGRLLLALLPEPEVMGLLALMLLNEARAPARVGADGQRALLEDQDRSRWDRGMIAEGISLVERALSSRRFGAYSLQAAIAAVHAEAQTAAATDWRQISALYAALHALQPTPVIELNRAVAVAMHEGPATGLALIDAILARGELQSYLYAHSARADLHRRLGDRTAARSAYERALECGPSVAERSFIERRLRELE